MTMTPVDLMTCLTSLGYKPSLIPGGKGVQLLQLAHHHADGHRAYEMVLSIEMDAAGGYLRVLGPRLDLGPLSADLLLGVLDVQTVFSLFRFIHHQQDGVWGLRPILECPCIPAGLVVPDEVFTSMLAWAAELFDPAIGYLEILARQGVRERDLLHGEPMHLTPMRQRLSELKRQVMETERQIECVRRPRADSSLTVPKYL